MTTSRRLARGLAACVLLAAAAVTARPAADERTAVLLRRDCRSDLGRDEVTLFANGTVRLREGAPDDERMYLGELAPDALSTYVDAVRAEDLSETDREGSGPGGDWVARCRLEIDYAAMRRWLGPPPPREGNWHPQGARSFDYGRFDSLSLALSRVAALVDSLGERVDRAVGRHSLPPGYRPRIGDLLRRADGVLFRVVRQTADEHGWELQGEEQPLAIYVVEDDFATIFIELVKAN